MTPKWSLAVAWTVATAIALILTTVVTELVFVALLGFLLLPFVPLAGVVPGLMVGATQRVVLRRVVPDTGHWILVTASAFGLAWFVTLALGFYVTSGALILVACAVGATLVGCAQAALLRRWSRRALMWVPVSMAAWTAAAAVLLFGPRKVPGLSGPADRLVSWAGGFDTESALGTALLAGLAAGAISGSAVPWILNGRVNAPRARRSLR
jgi:hypothetical protein